MAIIVNKIPYCVKAKMEAQELGKKMKLSKEIIDEVAKKACIIIEKIPNANPHEVTRAVYHVVLYKLGISTSYRRRILINPESSWLYLVPVVEEILY